MSDCWDLEQRQRDTDLERGHDPDEPRHGRRYKREYDLPAIKAQDKFHRSRKSHHETRWPGPRRQMQRLDSAEREAYIIVAAELANDASDASDWPTMLKAVKVKLGAFPEPALADIS